LQVGHKVNKTPTSRSYKFQSLGNGYSLRHDLGDIVRTQGLMFEM